MDNYLWQFNSSASIVTFAETDTINYIMLSVYYIHEN